MRKSAPPPRSGNNALLVPQDAVLETQGQYQVAVVGSDNKVTMRTVEVGQQAGGLQIIEKGVSPGERVITEGLQKVRDGMEVKPQSVPSGACARRISGVSRPGALGRPRRPAARASTMSRFFINRPIVAMVIAIFFVITGAVMVFRLPVAQFPNIVPPQIQTTATYTGADALTVEQSVATPIEEQVNGAKNMLYMQSINNNDGTMTLQVSFAVGTDVDLDQVQVQNRLSQATSSLPNAVSNYGLTTQQTVGIPLLVFSITSPNRTWDQNFLANYVAINIQDELARIPGIGQVKIFGAANYAMRIWVAPDILSKLQLTVADLENAIAAQNVVNPAGQIGGAPAPPGQQLTYTVRAQGRLLNADEFGNIIVRANPDGSLVRLKDVARIQLGAETYTQQAYTNGAPSAIVGLYQNPGSNALEAANLAKAKMAELARHFPSDMNVDLTLDTTVPVTEGAREIVEDAARSNRPRDPGRIHLFAKLAGDVDPDAHYPGLAGGSLHVLSGGRVLDQHACAVGAGAGGRPGGRRRNRRGGGDRGKNRARDGRRKTRRWKRWTRSAERWSGSHSCCPRSSSRPDSWRE